MGKIAQDFPSASAQPGQRQQQPEQLQQQAPQLQVLFFVAPVARRPAQQPACQHSGLAAGRRDGRGGRL